MDIPHFSLPLRLAGDSLAVVEQDTADEIADCVLVVLLCPRDFRAELPEFGIDDPTFAQTAPDAEAIAVAVADWEPRAHAAVTSEPEAFDALAAHVEVRLGMPPED